jgi:hypothetical protein
MRTLAVAPLLLLVAAMALPPVGRPSRTRYRPVSREALLGRWVSDEVEAEFSARRGGGSFRLYRILGHNFKVEELAPRGGGIAYVNYVNRRKASRPGVIPAGGSTAYYDFPDARTVRIKNVGVGHLCRDGRLRLTLTYKDQRLPPEYADRRGNIAGLPWPPGTTFTLRWAKAGAGRGGPPAAPPAGRGRPPGRGEQTAPVRGERTAKEMP